MQTVTPLELAQRLQLSPPVLLDVREHWEVQLAALPHALHIPMGEISHRWQELPADADIVVYCHHGVRSAHVVAFLERVGMSRVYNLAGGIDAWSAEIDPTVARY